MKMKVSDYIAKFFEKKGLKHLFMLAGGGCIHMVDSFGRSEIDAIPMIHEQGAAIAAEAYAQYTNEPSALLVTTGPGGTNAITGVTSAWLDSVPMVVLSGQVQRKDMIGDTGCRQIGFQEVDIVPMVSSITKYAKTIMHAEDIPVQLAKAYDLANMGRKGPVWLDIPLDIQSAEIDVSDAKETFYREEMIPELDMSVVAGGLGAATMLHASRRPIILLGNGARSSIDFFLHLLDVTGVPVMTTWKAADLIPEDHPLFVGRPGGIAQRGANLAQQEADLIICIGARLDHGQTGYRPDLFAKDAKKVIVDVSMQEAYKHPFAHESGTLNVIGQASDFIREFRMAPHMDTRIRSQFSDWRKRCRQLKAENSVITDVHRETLNPYSFIDALSDAMDGDEILVPGSSGTVAEVTMQAFRVKHGQRIINSQGLGSMGFALPAAIGVAFASGKRVVCLDGDGSFAMNMQEMAVVAKHSLPIKIFIFNNGGYVSIRNTQDKLFNGEYVGSADSGINFSELFAAFDITPAEVLLDSEDLLGRLLFFIGSPIPELYDVRMSKKHQTVPRTKSYMNDDGQMETAPMDDLYMGDNDG